jgi:hypothetical protein
MMRVSLRDSNDALCEIAVSGPYNPDILDDIQRRVIKTYNEYQGAAEALESTAPPTDDDA